MTTTLSKLPCRVHNHASKNTTTEGIWAKRFNVIQKFPSPNGGKTVMLRRNGHVTR